MVAFTLQQTETEASFSSFFQLLKIKRFCDGVIFENYKLLSYLYIVYHVICVSVSVLFTVLLSAGDVQ